MADTRDDSMTKPLHRLPGPTRARQEWLLLGAVLLAVAAFGVWSRYDEFRALEVTQRHLLNVQAQAIDEHLSRQLVAAGEALRGVRDDLAVWPADAVGARGASRLRALSGAMPGVRTLLLLDRDGKVLAADRPELLGADFAQRPWFAQARGQPDPQRLRLSAPERIAAGVYTMNLSLPIAAADGGFGGVVSATLDPDYFRVVLLSTLYAPDVWTGIAHGDGLLLMVEPAGIQPAGVNLDRPGSFFRRHLDTGQQRSAMTGIVATTKEARMMAQRTVNPAAMALDKPLVVAVSRSLEAMFAPWWRQTWTDLVLFLLLAGMSSLALVAIQRRQRAIERLELRREADERLAAERLELALRGADLALWDFDLRTGVSTVNERWTSMLGEPYQATFADAAFWSDRIHPDDRPRAVAAQQNHLDGHSERLDVTYRMRHADGHWVWIHDRGQVLERDAQGRALRMVGTHMDISQRMQEQLALQRSEQSLATTLYSIGDAVIATDAQGRVVRMNATAERLCGWPEHEALGQPLAAVFRIVSARSRQPALDPVHQVIDHGEVVGLANDTLLLARDGSEYQIADSAAPIRTPGGGITGVVLVFSDVTERYRVQQALRANEERLRSLLDNLGSGVIVHAADTQVLDANPAACRIVGLTLDQMRGKVSVDPHWAFLEEDGQVMTHERFPVPQVLAHGDAVRNLILGVRRADLPEPLWLVVNAYPLRDGHGAIEQVVVTFSDITELKEAEQRTRSARAELEATLEAVPDLLFDVDLDGRIWNFRSPRRDLLVVAPEAFLGRTVNEVLPPDAAQVVMAALQQAGASGHSSGLQYSLSLPDGSHWFELSVAHKPTPDGPRVRFIVLARDITERKHGELERQALERQLREAQKIESIGTLAGGIAHDFNNILAAILGNVALARADLGGDHPALASLDQINRAGLRARHLVQQILTFSRRDQRGLSWQPLAPVVQETLDLLRATLPAGVRLEAVIPEAPLAVRGDSTQLQQVLLNLCTNAWHALPVQGGRIEVGFERVTLDEAQHQRVPGLAPGPCAHLWVRDNGSGMDEATRQRIFDPFFTTKTVGLGTGLGLPVVHGIVLAHDGAITVDTAPGQGSTFHVYFPLSEPELPEPVSERLPAAATPGDGQHVLYIDDDELMVVMVERLLARAGFRVTTQTDAAAAVALVRERPQDYDVVVTDYNMPELSGLDVAEQLARLQPALPVVMISGYLSDTLHTQAAQAGVRALVAKENTFEELAALLKRLLAHAAPP